LNRYGEESHGAREPNRRTPGLIHREDNMAPGSAWRIATRHAP
jgi:hypothetical protein